LSVQAEVWRSRRRVLPVLALVALVALVASLRIASLNGCGPGCLEYRTGNLVARGQLCKIVVLAEGWTLYTPPTPTFRDVPTTGTFYGYTETAYNHSIVSGYTCGASCLELRPGNNATRGQISKIVYLGSGISFAGRP
jgi:hypothetical protein